MVPHILKLLIAWAILCSFSLRTPSATYCRVSDQKEPRAAPLSPGMRMYTEFQYSPILRSQILPGIHSNQQSLPPVIGWFLPRFTATFCFRQYMESIMWISGHFVGTLSDKTSLKGCRWFSVPHFHGKPRSAPPEIIIIRGWKTYAI